jgi:hypothetical protein
MSRSLDRDAAGRELARVLRIIGRRKEALAAYAKDERGAIAKLEERAAELALIADGAAIQEELDTGPASARVSGELHPEAAKVLGEARAVAERKGRRS